MPELERRGYALGRNIQLIEKNTEGDLTQLDRLSRELLSERPDVVIAVSAPAALAIRRHDTDIPIVLGFTGSDPVADGLAESIGRPGGRTTGLLLMADELDVKRLELAAEIVGPNARIGFLVGSLTAGRRAALQDLPNRLSITIVPVLASGPDTYDAAFDELKSAKVSIVVVGSFASFAGNAEALAKKALSAGLPTICEWSTMAHAGCVIGFGPNSVEMRRRVGLQVSRILAGENPGVIPMESPSRFDFAVNLKSARALGISLPASILARADEVIE